MTYCTQGRDQDCTENNCCLHETRPLTGNNDIDNKDYNWGITNEKGIIKKYSYRFVNQRIY